MSELRQTVRSLYRHPGFSVAVISTLALAIALVTAVLAVIDSVLLRPLPFAEPERIVALWESAPQDGTPKRRVAAATFNAWKSNARSYDRMALYGASTYTINGAGDAFQTDGARVTEDFFPILGVPPAAGRTFSAAEYQAGAERVVIVSAALAAQHFGSARNAIGKIVRLDETPVTIVGVLPAQVFPVRASFAGAVDFVSGRDFVWEPTPVPPPRNAHVFGVLARLRNGVTFAKARAEMNVIAPDTRMLTLVEEAVGGIEGPLWMAMAAVTFVLLVASANIAGLLLVRASARARELAVRRALGAGTSRVFRLVAGESILLSLAGGVAGLLASIPLLRVLPLIIPRDVPRLADASIDFRISLAAALLSMLCGVVVAAIALPSTRQGIANGERTTSRDGSVRALLVVAQVAIAVVLLIGAGLLLRSMNALRHVDPGFEPANVLVVQVSHSSTYREQHQLTNYYDGLFERLRALPDVVSVAAAYDPPLRSNWSQAFSLEGRGDAEDTIALFRTVTPDYFRTAGVTLLQGRGFSERDDARAPGAMIVNEAFVSRFLSGGPALGRRIHMTTTQWEWGETIPRDFTIVGLVESERMASLDAPAEAAFYIPYRQTPHHQMSVLIRTRRDPRMLVPALRAIARQVDASVPLANVTTLRDIVGESLARPKFNALVFALFAGVGLFLTVMGIGAVVAQMLRQRMRELGVRIAIGAAPADIARFVLRHGTAPPLAGICLGIPLALLLTRLLRHMLFGVSAWDPFVYIATVVLLVLAAIAICVPSALRAARIDPARILREE